MEQEINFLGVKFFYYLNPLKHTHTHTHTHTQIHIILTFTFLSFFELSADNFSKFFSILNFLSINTPHCEYSCVYLH